MHKPIEIHWTTTLRILSYVKGSPKIELLYKKYGYAHISTYSNASYACNMGNRKSTAGYCTIIRGNFMTWRVIKRCDISISSTEAEYRAMFHTIYVMM